ncbi:MAG: hypothetical protein D3924_17730 [Candidatus Electrothrix sp. AR4]|nr:hypothetical protein [Candidatus Electrothrix sp. AR4]
MKKPVRPAFPAAVYVARPAETTAEYPGHPASTSAIPLAKSIHSSILISNPYFPMLHRNIGKK